MYYLSGEEVLIIHSDLIDITGGAHGMRDINLFLSILEKPKTQFGGKELYPDVFQKAAVYLESFVRYHVFIDGNKRTAIAVSARFLFMNGFDMRATNKKIEHFVLLVATERLELEKITTWFKRHSRKL